MVNMLEGPRFDLQHQKEKRKEGRKERKKRKRKRKIRNSTFLVCMREAMARSPMWVSVKLGSIFGTETRHWGEDGTYQNTKDRNQDFIPDGKV